MHNLRSAGKFATRKQYALNAVLLALKELKTVRWVQCAALSYLIAWPLAIYIDTQQPIEYARAEEIATPPVAEVKKPVLIEVKIDWTRERIDQEIEIQAKKYGKSSWRLKKTIQNESQYRNVQSDLLYTFTDARRGIFAGEREKSFGICQIHLPDHPQISRKQAEDPAFCIDFMARKIDTIPWYGDPMRM